jgi:hypothetical protein
MCQKDGEVKANGKEDRNCVKTLLPLIIIFRSLFLHKPPNSWRVYECLACRAISHTVVCTETWSILVFEDCFFKYQVA